MKKILFLLLLTLLSFTCISAETNDYTGSYELNQKEDISFHLYLKKNTDNSYEFSLLTGWVTGEGDYMNIKTRAVEGTLEKVNNTYKYTDPDNDECTVSITMSNKTATVKEKGCENDVNFSGKYKFTKKEDTSDQFMVKQTDGKWETY